MASLEIKNVTKKFGETIVLDGIDFGIDDGEFLVLVGPSGCGKSTLLNIIAGLETETSGGIMINGRMINDVHPKDRDIAMVFQSYALYPNMTVRKNITFGLEVRKVPRAEINDAVARVSELLQIQPLLGRKPSQLSGGQRQRVAMGRALVRDPSIFLFDEPLSNLDAKLRVEMRIEMKKLHHRLGTTIIYVTHDQTEAMNLATRIAVLDRGRIQQLGPPQYLYDHPDNLFVAGFIGSPAMNFLPGSLSKLDGQLLFRPDDGEGDHLVGVDQYPFTATPEDGDEVIFGVRPESVTLPDEIESGNLFEMELVAEAVESNGFDKNVAFTYGKSELIGRFSAKTEPVIKQPMRIGMDLSNISLFDRRSKQRL
jgi:multiple sugar transport system ATP-binding protein